VSEESQKVSLGVRIALAVGAVLLLALLVWGIRAIMASKNGKPARQVQVVQVIRPPPPPPENQPPPPPPEKVDEPLPQDQPEPSPSDEAAPSEQLGLDAEGGAGGDAFGLAARKGGHEITGGGGAIFAWYTQILKDAIVDRLSSDKALRSKKFTIVVKVWIAPDGQVKEARLVSASGAKDVDGAIEAVLTRLGRLREAPPLEMPQPVSLRIVSRS
jgi:periplasmic protein TonB